MDESVDNEQEEQPSAADQKRSPSGGRKTALFRENIEILIDKPLSYLDQGPAKAYRARPKGEATDGVYFALICAPGYPPRMRTAQSLGTLASPSLPRLVSSGIMFWPPAKEERYIFLYENNLGNPLMLSLEESGIGWKPDKVIEAIIKPVINTLLDMRDRDIFHGAIRPTNIFDGGVKNVERVILGECLATPPGATQPVDLEPVYRGMADPLGRGVGGPDDDLYAFGVSLAMMLRTKNPLKGLTGPEIVHRKIQQGSYTALIGTERLPGPMLELLRGLLFDDSSQRWTLNEVTAWLDGQRLSPKQSARPNKASRPLVFHDEKYLWPSLLAMDMHKDQTEAVQLITNGQLEQWIERSLEDSILIKRLSDAVESAESHGRGAGYWDRLLCRVSIALDPKAPLRLKGLNIRPEGIPYALLQRFVQGGDLQPFVDIFQQKLVSYWLNAQIDTHNEVFALASKFENCRVFMNQKNSGYGIERCLYFLCPDAPCMSDKLKGYYVYDPQDLLHAYEEISQRSDRPKFFIDRHVAAFLSVKERKCIDPYLVELNAPEEYLRVMGNLATLATIQKRERMGMLPGITDWIADLLDPVYARFHDKDLQKDLREKVSQFRKSGDIGKIFALLDNEDTARKDSNGFQRAMKEHKDLDDEAVRIELNLSKPETFGKRTGQEVAAIFSAVLAGIIILAFAFLAFSQRTIF
ncbi:MAG: hypothetical protein KDJ15_06995 [Alphaproteobacteria bacterium]|nr:hypothetical protein [Alphaproteobacteria bacterium]